MDNHNHIHITGENIGMLTQLTDLSLSHFMMSNNNLIKLTNLLELSIEGQL